MPRPSSRLDLLLVPPDDAPHDPAPLDALGQAQGWWTADGMPGPSASALVEGGFVRRAVEPDPGTPRLVANHQGGFRVACPACGTSIVPTFQRALTAWRAGAAREATCPSCGWTGDLADLAFAPAATFARTVVRIADVGDARLSSDAHERITSAWGPFRVIAQRVG